MNKKLIKTLLQPIAGKKVFQNFFEKLHLFSIYGMNYGNGSFVDKSGELNALKYVANKIKTGNPVIFDVGANVGDYTRELHNLFGGKAEIHAFEPSKKTFAALSKNVGSINNIRLNNMGLGDKKDILKLYSNKDESGIASIYDRQLDHLNSSMEQFEEIQINTLDQYCIDNSISKIDFLKLDVEGHELMVLEGAKSILGEQRIHFIQFEFGGCNIDSKTFFQNFYYLLKDNYKIYRILVDGLSEIKNYRETLEIFTTVNYLAELKSN